MFVTCPNCLSRYVVQSESIGSGKLVRCAVCGTVWQQMPVDEAAQRKKRIWDIVNWTVFYATVFTSFAFLFGRRDFMIEKWPASESFYKYVGMCNTGVKDSTFLLDNVSYFFVRKSGDLYIGLRGELTNTSVEAKAVPSIAITLKNDPEVDTIPFKKVWVHKLQYEKLLPTQKVLFETKLQRVQSDNLLCDIKLNFR